MNNPTQFPNGESTFLIDGPAGHLELLTLANETTPKAVAVICHPHPLHQGTMNNKVIHTLSRAFYHKGIHAVRFNFRGVGKSEGQFGHSEGEVADLMAVLAWVDTVLPQTPLYLAGFSFGAYIAAKGSTLHPCQQLFSIAPAVTNQPYQQLPIISCPWVVIQGGKDDVIAPSEVYAWYDKEKARQPQIHLLKMENASHFFHGCLIPLRTLVEESIIEPSL